MIDSTLKQANILIVDDQDANIDVLEGFLSMQGFSNIFSTTDPRDVLQLFARHQPDIILLDLMMPYMDGFEVMEQLKSLIGKDMYLPILVLTADATEETKQRALSSGAFDFLIKPFDLVEIGLRINNLLYTAYLQQELRMSNHNLEKKVEERTLELSKKNIELEVARDKAQESDQLKTQFLYNISHEIRTPLNGILGFGEILVNEELPLEERKMFFELLKESSERLTTTVTNVIDLSLLMSNNIKRCDTDVNLGSIVKNVVNDFMTLFNKKSIDLKVFLPEIDDRLKIISDGEIIKKALRPLVDNAYKFTEQGNVEIGYELRNRDVVFFVADTGIGISEEYQKKVFDIFSQEEKTITRRFEGNGIGLSIFKGMIGLLNGEIVINSGKGNGTRVEFVLHDVIEDNN